MWKSDERENPAQSIRKPDTRNYKLSMVHLKCCKRYKGKHNEQE